MIRQIRFYSVEILLTAALLASVGFFGYLGYGLLDSAEEESAFSGEKALNYAARQMAFGPRVTGTENSVQMGDWLVDQLRQLGWDVVIQPFEVADGVSARNIVAIQGQGTPAILGAHYDTRMVADADPDAERRNQPVPGANDGASGVAVLIELAHTLNVEATDHTICLVFFDAEDNGRLPGWDWILGSRYFVEHLADDVPRCHPPRFAVIVDMIGDADQQIYLERNSTPGLRSAIWTVAAELGYADTIVNEVRHSMLDDHTPFLEAGIPAANVIDFDYPYWHTTEDTIDKLSAESLARVGHTLKMWLELGAPFQP